MAQQLRDEDREATPDERVVLAGFRSWGAVPEIFDERSDRLAAARAELQQATDTQGYRAARRTVLNAHYTDAAYADAIWGVVTGLGFTGGEVLEPGCGAGAFIGSAPSSARMTGVELDPTTTSIAGLRFPAATIRAESFAVSPFADDTFDAAIGNVPFASVSLHDPVHNRGQHSLHNHFILKSLDLVRPGGVVAVLTSRYTLDAAGEKARQEMQDKADFLGAVRLPTGAHQAVAGTDAITDLVVFRKRGAGETPGDDSWVHASSITLTDRDGIQREVGIGSWFTEHPEMVLGELAVDHGLYGQELVVRDTTASSGAAVTERFEDACAGLVQRATANGVGWTPRAADAPVIDPSMVVEPVARSGSISGFDGHLAFEGEQWTVVRSGRREPIEVSASQHRQLRDLVGLRDAAVALLDAEAATLEDTEDIAALRAGLTTRYEAYVGRFGPVNKVTVTQTSRLDKNGDPIISRRYPAAMRTFRADPHQAVVSALEFYDERTGVASKAPIFTERVVAPRVVPTTADTPEDALAITLDTDGRVDLGHVARLLGIEEGAARTRLGELVFEDPSSPGELVPAAAYLSGNVRQALAVAETAAVDRPEFAVNVAALRSVVPADLGPEDITARLGAVWVPDHDVRDFLAETLGDDRVTVTHAGGSNWKVTGTKQSQAAVSEWGTERLDAITMTQRLMQQKRIVVIDVIDDGESERRVVNAVETEAAKAKAEQLQARFGEWLWEDPARTERLVRTYNDTFNSLVLRDYTADGARLSLPGLTATFTPHEHQRTAVARMISEPAVGLYHGVGAGKTAEMVMGAMELGRLGLVSKPAVVVPNHMLEQVSREWLQLYPQATILTAGSEDLRGDGRRAFIARAATGSWDAVVMTQGAFGSLPVAPATERAYMDRELSLFRDQLNRMREGDSGHGMTVKRMEKSLLAMEERLTKKLDSKRDDGLTFEQTGIDYLLVDELHLYKNLTIVSNIEGVARDGSQRATDLDMKIDYLRTRAQEAGRSARVITGATATPIANSMAEAYVMQRYLRPDLLEEVGITDFDAWASTFGESVTELEMAPEGGSFRPKTRFAQFNNLPELLRMWHVSADVKTAQELQLNVPDLIDREGVRAPETVVVPQSEQLQAVMTWIGERAERVRNGQVDPTEDNMLKISSDGRKAALDLRLLSEDDQAEWAVHLDGGTDPRLIEMGKLDVAAGRIHRIWSDHAGDQFVGPDGELSPARGGLQIVFCDLGTPGEKWNAYDELKARLVDRGMDPGRVRFIHEANTDAKKDRLFAECRGGGVDVIIGSTAKMGVGTNIQTRAVALHHLDCPWRPADVEQREGRIIRQGNQNPEVEMLRYVVEGSFDGYMWQTVERKQKFIEQVMHGTLDTRSAEDIGTDSSLNYSEVKALASGNPLLLEKAQADQELAKLTNLASAHARNQRQRVTAVKIADRTITGLDEQIPVFQAAIDRRVSTKGEAFRASVAGHPSTDRAEVGRMLLEQIGPVMSSFDADHRNPSRRQNVVQLGGHAFDLEYTESLGGKELRFVMAGTDGLVKARLQPDEATGAGLVARLENTLTGLEAALDRTQQQRATAVRERDTAQSGIGAPFEHADRLAETRDLVDRLNQELTGPKDDLHDEEVSQRVTVAPDQPPTASTTPGREPGHEPDQATVNRDGIAKVREAIEQLKAAQNRATDQPDPQQQRDAQRYRHREDRAPRPDEGGPRLT